MGSDTTSLRCYWRILEYQKYQNKLVANLLATAVHRHFRGLRLWVDLQRFRETFTLSSKVRVTSRRQWFLLRIRGSHFKVCTMMHSISDMRRRRSQYSSSHRHPYRPDKQPATQTQSKCCHRWISSPYTRLSWKINRDKLWINYNNRREHHNFWQIRPQYV